MERPKGAVECIVKKIVSAKFLTLEKSVSTDYTAPKKVFTAGSGPILLLIGVRFA
ncbi:hypothetical protein ACN1NW_000420 [Acinetobacter baumannii]|nr:hypothetical protein [Acinetobacter baumannii]ELA7031008.1 hypothetical protein [Acinetobacter baumannii]ELA7118771.1 hypothetical protein [Acinetobacter baumannii]ELB0919720.1 hypothetical protein [Acinetobacter baumannii]ELB0965897.1 hypothetical protein [Acinetobacter baumannii]